MVVGQLRMFEVWRGRGQYIEDGCLRWSSGLELYRDVVSIARERMLWQALEYRIVGVCCVHRDCIGSWAGIVFACFEGIGIRH